MKKLTAFMVSILMVLNIGLMYANAGANQEFLENVYQDEDGMFHILCAIPGEEGGAENFEVLLGTEPLSIRSASTVGQEGVPKTVYCLVDISGSMKGRMEQAKEALFAISGGLGQGDSLVVGRMGNEITDSALLSGQEEMKAEIGSLRYTGEDTDLYSGLIHGLKYLQQEPGVNTMKALVVLSDGCDDQGDGSTWKEAYEAVKRADIPVYTAAIILSPADYEAAKELGSFARNSAGGRHFPLSGDSGSKPVPMTGGEMGEAILISLEDTFALTADGPGAGQPERDAYTLSVTFKGEAGKVYEDSKEIAAKDLRMVKEEAEPEPSQPETQPADEPADGPGDQPEEPANKLPWIIGGVLAVVLAAAAALAVRSKKKKEEQKRLEEERLRQEEEKRQEAERLEKERGEQRRLAEEKERQEKILAEQAAREEARRREQEAYDAIPRLSVRLSAIGLPDKRCTLELVKGYEMTVGRNSKAKIVLDPRDTRLSGIHFTMLWDGRGVYLWDSHSKNGTSVNGVVVNQLGKVSVKPGDSLRAGSYEYRMYWED